MNGVMAGRAELVCVANANHLKAKTRENITNSDRIIISWKCLSKICVKFCFFVLLRRKHDLRWRISTFVLGEGGGGIWRMLFEEPRIWTSGFNLRTLVLKSMTTLSRTSWHAQWLSCCKNISGWRPWYRVLKLLSITSRTWWNRLSL